ncbi:hypothetical protein J2Y83_003311 [Pseudomonas marginalis]|nr:hypothetical protein [Pseudomonas marginalis]MCP1524842.1 hypothetical protein [Pseudomonas marginalis]MDQ0502901.1 hypothetical protein [Pseudomonas marginalis]
MDAASPLLTLNTGQQLRGAQAVLANVQNDRAVERA